ncbi:MAG TPA: IS21-like element helper ATPase IstB [Patescibacteria group bacterium]
MGRNKITRYGFEEGNSQEEKLKKALKLLELDGAARALSAINKIIIEKKLSFLDGLEYLIDEDFSGKEDTRIERWTKQAKFPWTKRVEDYDFNFPEFIEKEKVLKLAECSWIKEGINVLFLGPPGVGKTHLSIALGMEAINNSYETKFVTIDRLTEAIANVIAKDKEQGGGKNRNNLINSYVKIPLLIIDELSYSKVNTEVAELLFQIIHRRNEAQKSIIWSTNEGFDKWTDIFENKIRAAAAIDRLVANAVFVSIKGKSWRHREIAFNKSDKKKVVQKT